MNEELKIIIKAVTASAKKSIQEVRKELEGVDKAGKDTGKGMSATMKGISKSVGVAIAAIAAITAAIVALGKKSLQAAKEYGKLVSAFNAVGASTKTAETAYKGFYRFLGDSGKATEAASHLALIASNQEQLAEWTKISQGIYARFGDSLPIEGLTEAANETLRVGKITGTLADALNWAGVSEDAFNAKLAQTTSYEEREVLLRTTLNGLYSEAAELYEKNNRALIEHNESQARVEMSLRNTGAVITPLLTALNNLSATLLNALKPALDVIIPILTSVVEWLTRATQSIMSFFGALTGQSSSVSTAAKNIGAAANSAGNLGSGMSQVEDNALGAEAAIEKAKRAAMGFDELNIVPSGATSSSSSSGTGTSGSTTPSYATNNGFTEGLDITTTVKQTETTTSKLLETIKKVANEMSVLFAPTKKAWTEAFQEIKVSWNQAVPHFTKGADDFKKGFESVATYVTQEFVPDIVNAFSVHIAPVIADLSGFTLVELGEQFEWLGDLFNRVSNDIIIPALDSVKLVASDIFEIIGNSWDENGDPVKEEASEAFDNLRGHIDLFYETTFKPVFDNIKAKFDEVWTNKLKPALSEVSDSLLGIGEDLLKLYNDFIAPVVNWIIVNIGPVIEKAFNTILNIFEVVIGAAADVIAGVVRALEGVIGFITGIFTGDWEKAWEGISTFFTGIWDSITAVVSNAWEKIKEVFAPVGEWFTDTFTKAKEGMIGAFDNVKKGFSNVWKNVKEGFGNVSGWFKDTFTKAWTAVKNVFSKGGKIFDGIKDGILNGLKTVINKIIEGINKVIAVPFKGLNTALTKIKEISIFGLKPFDWINTISIPSIPKLAKGGIVNSETLARIGEGGKKEAVLPLEQNTEWMDKLAEKIASKNATPSKIVLTLDGKELGWANIHSINSITRQTGSLPLVLV